MRMTRARIGRLIFSLTWLGGIALALRVGVTAYDTNPEHVLALLVSTYLALWGLLLFRSSGERTHDALRFAICTCSILTVVLGFELPALINVIDYRAVFATPTPAWKRPGQHPDRELLYVRDGHQRIRRSFQG